MGICEVVERMWFSTPFLVCTPEVMGDVFTPFTIGVAFIQGRGPMPVGSCETA